MGVVLRLCRGNINGSVFAVFGGKGAEVGDDKRGSIVSGSGMMREGMAQSHR